MGPAGQTSYEDTVLSDAVNKTVSESSNIKHRFPVEHQGDYEGSISFYAFEEDYIELKDIETGIINLKKKETEKLTATADEQADIRGNDVALTDIKPRKFKGDPKGAVSLYLPASLQFADGIEYSNTAIGARGALAEQGIANSGSAGAIMASLGDLPLLDIMKNGVTGPAGQLALQRVLGKTPIVGGENIQNVAALTSGLTLNPNSRSLLRGVNTRTFRFTFNLIPTSVDESRAIRNIIKFFRSAMYPDDIGGNDVALTDIKPRKFKGDPKGAVSLYLPASLQFADGIEYSNTAIGARGALAEQGIANSGSAGAIMASLGDLPLLDIMKNGVTGPAGQLALQRVLGKTPIVGGENIQNVAALTSGLTLNPNSRSLLRGVNTRTFRFTFNLIPTSVDESRAIRNIIKFFRSAMYPDDIGGKQGATIGYKFPHKFIIKMRYKKKTVATGILPCFLENFETNYNPNTMGMMSDGSFPEINISMGFREERTLRKKDIDGGY